MDNATQEFMIGDRVRYVGLTVVGVGRGDVGEVFRPPARHGNYMYWVKFPGHVDLSCWPAELELVDRPTSPVAAAFCIVCGQTRMAGRHTSRDVVAHGTAPEWHVFDGGA